MEIGTKLAQKQKDQEKRIPVNSLKKENRIYGSIQNRIY